MIAKISDYKEIYVSRAMPVNNSIINVHLYLPVSL